MPLRTCLVMVQIRWLLQISTNPSEMEPIELTTKGTVLKLLIGSRFTERLSWSILSLPA